MKAVTRSTGTVAYVLKDDRSLTKEEQSVFYLRPMTQGERMDAYDGMNETTVTETGVVKQQSKAWRQALENCISHIDRIDNFPAGQGKEWPTDAKARAQYLEQLDALHINELGTAIREASTMSTDAGN